MKEVNEEKKQMFSDFTLGLIFMNINLVFMTGSQSLAKYVTTELKVAVMDLCVIRTGFLMFIALGIAKSGGHRVF